MTSLTLYGSSVASTTLTTANKLATTTGGTETSTTTTASDSSGTNQYYMEVYSQGGTVGDSASIPSPDGHGFLLDSTVLEGQAISAGNWSATFRENDTANFTAVTMIIRAYKRSSSGTYTSIGSMQVTGQSMSSTTTPYTIANTTFSSMTFSTGDKLYLDHLILPTTGHWAGDPIKLFLSNSATAGVANDFQINTPGYVSSGTTVTKTLPTRFRLRVQRGLTIVTRFIQRVQSTRTLPTRFVERTQKSVTLVSRFLERVGVNKTLQTRTRLRVRSTLTMPFRFVMKRYTQSMQFRALLRVLVSRTVQTRAIVRVQRTLTAPFRLVMKRYTLIIRFRALIRTLKSVTLPMRALIRTQVTRTLPTRFLERVLNSTTLQFRFRLGLQAIAKVLMTRFRLRVPNTTTIAFRFRLAGTFLASGGFTLFANGPGTAKFDSFRATQFPDPALSLAPIVPRTGVTSALWNAIIPTNTTLGVDISLDGVNWTDVSSSNGGTFPGIFSQPDPVIDGFKTNTSTNYTSTNRTGGAPATVTYDTTNSRLSLTGGTNAIYLYTAINDNDIDFFVDMDRADSGGMVWRYVDQNNFYSLQIGDTLASVGTPNTATLYKVSANVQTQLATSPIAYTVGNPGSMYTVNFTRGTYRRFRVSMLGSAITVYVDGVQLLTYTDGSPIASGLMGLYNNGGTVGSRYYQLWMQQIGDYVSGTPAGDTVTGKFVYTRQRLTTTDPSVSPQVLDLTTNAFTPMISPGVTIPAITYNASFLNKNFDDLAKQSNFSWYIDQNKNFVFRAGATVAAPWILQSAPAGLVTNVDLEVDTNLELDVSNDLYRNRQIILGATSTASFTETKIGDGSTRTFTLGYPLAGVPTLILNGVAKTNIGLKGTTGHDYYYALNDPVIVQDPSNTVLQNSDNLVVPYTGVTTATVIVDNVPEQQARALAEGQGTGIVEAVEDHTGKGLTVAAATTLAQQLIARYAIAGRTLIFQTSRNGLAIGQTLTIFLPEHGINDGQFLINQIEIFLTKGVADTQTWWYKITASELPKQDSWAKLVASGIALQ